MSFNRVLSRNIEITKIENRYEKNNTGITLIALVVSIVVLLILSRSKYCNIIWR